MADITFAGACLLALGYLVSRQDPNTSNTATSNKTSNTNFNCRQTGDVIVQLFEWSWKDIAEECRTFLPQHGYTAVQTSPVTEHIVLKTSSWTDRYQPVSYKIISRSGNEEDFSNMVKVCNEHKIKVYVDVVLNHMTERDSSAVGIGRSPVNTWEKDYPGVPYNSSDFHTSCNITNWMNVSQVRNCELEGRNDLNQTRQNVRDRIVEFLNKLIDIGVAGFRVSDAKHIDVQDLAAIYSRVKNLNSTYFPDSSQPYIYHEVSPTPILIPRRQKEFSAIKFSDYFKLGAVEDIKFNYQLSQSFSRKEPLSQLKTSELRMRFLNWNNSVVYVDNHNTQRGSLAGFHVPMSLSYDQDKWYKMATGFMLAWPHAVSRVMSSYDFEDIADGPPSGPDGMITPVIRNSDLTCSGGWVCEHRWRQIHSMVHFRKTVIGSEVSDWWSEGKYQIAFCRRGKGFVAFNLEAKIHLNATLQTRLPSGDYCDVISGSKIEVNNTCSGKRVTVGTDGRAHILLRHDEEDGILAIHVEAKIE